MKFKFNLNKLKPIKALLFGKKEYAGRNNSGCITVGQRGGGHKQKYRIIDFKRNNNDKSIVLNVEYDPNRTARIANIISQNKVSYILAPKGLKILDRIYTENKQNMFLQAGDSFFLNNMPLGSIIHNIELNKNQGAKFVRAGGMYAQLLQKDENFARIRLMSGHHRFFSLNCKATLGVISNEKHTFTVIGKAGKSRWLNKRPNVRGTAMNPVDHPHGGGAGKSASGRPSVTPWSRPTKGAKTRSKKKKNILIVSKNDYKK
jgi:large subunit ribosomal protein L2